MTAIRSHRAPQSRHRGPALSGLALACILAVGNASAAYPVSEVGPSLIQHMLNQINTYTTQIEAVGEYSEQAMRWKATLAHYQQQLVKMQAMISAIGLPQAQTLSKVDVNYLVAEKCPAQGSSGVTEMIAKPFELNPEGDLMEQQRQICVNIRTMQNRKYNDTVEYLLSTAPQVDGFLNKLDGLRVSSNEQGAMEHSDNEALRLSNKLSSQGQQWSTRMQAYDAYIQIMEENQRTLAQGAMKGKRSMIGALIKTAALKAALSVD